MEELESLFVWVRSSYVASRQRWGRVADHRSCCKGSPRVGLGTAASECLECTAMPEPTLHSYSPFYLSFILASTTPPPPPLFWAFGISLRSYFFSFPLASNPVYKVDTNYLTNQAIEVLLACLRPFLCRAAVRFSRVPSPSRAVPPLHIPPLSHPSSYPCLLLPLGRAITQLASTFHR
jgi:hypothetical protein